MPIIVAILAFLALVLISQFPELAILLFWGALFAGIFVIGRRYLRQRFFI